MLWNSCRGSCQKLCHEDLCDKEHPAGLMALSSAITTRGHCLIVTGEINHYKFNAKLQRFSSCWLKLISDTIRYYLFVLCPIYSVAICSGSTLRAESMPRERQLCCSSPGKNKCLVLLLCVSEKVSLGAQLCFLWEGRRYNFCSSVFIADNFNSFQARLSGK